MNTDLQASTWFDRLIALSIERRWLVLLVMAAYLAGVTRAPLTSFIIMMEMTDSHHMLMPLMATALIASAASKAVCRTPLYHALANRLMPAPEAVPSQVPARQADPG